MVISFVRGYFYGIVFGVWIMWASDFWILCFSFCTFISVSGKNMLNNPYNIQTTVFLILTQYGLVKYRTFPLKFNTWQPKLLAVMFPMYKLDCTRWHTKLMWVISRESGAKGIVESAFSFSWFLLRANYKPRLVKKSKKCKLTLTV